MASAAFSPPMPYRPAMPRSATIIRAATSRASFQRPAVASA